MKKRNGWLYAFWILLIVIVVVVVAAGAISWAGSSDNEETSGSSVTGVTLDKEQLDLETEGDNSTGTLTATVATDTGETFGGAFSWNSLNEDVATVVGDDDTATVTAVSEGATIVTVTAGGESAVCLVVVSESEPGAALVAELSATESFSMDIDLSELGFSDPISATVKAAMLSLYSDGSATLDVDYSAMVIFTGSMSLPCTYTIVDDVITLTITGFGDGEGTVVYDNDGAIAGINFTSFAGDEQDITFITDGYEGSLYVSRRLEAPDPENDELDAAAMKLNSTESFEGCDYTVAKSATENEDGETETAYLITGTASAMTEDIAKWYNGGETGAAKAGDSYITLKIFVGIGNKISYTSAGNEEKSYTNTDGTGSFDGDYFFVCERLTGVNGDGSQVQTLDGVSYTISDALGTVSEEVNIEFDMRTAPWDGESISTAWDLDGDSISKEETYTIYSAEELAGLAHLVNDDSDAGVDNAGNHHSSDNTWVNLTRYWTVKLGADIDLGDEEWEPIGGVYLYQDSNGNNENSQFRGSFDGQGHTVYNLKVTRTDHVVYDGYDGTGLFGFVGGGEVKNLTVENANVYGRELVGGIVGVTYEFNSADTDGTVNIDNCHVTGHVEITGHHQVGGILGSGSKVEFTDCSVDGDATSFIQSTYAVNDYEDEDSHTSDYDGDAVGGIAGYLTRSNNNFAPTSGQDERSAESIQKCQTDANELTGCAVSDISVSGCRKVGGLVGHTSGSVNYAGCSVEGCTIALVYNSAYESANNEDVTGMDQKLFVGALVGEFEWVQTVTADCTVSNVTVVYLTEYGISGNYTPNEDQDNPYEGLFGGSRNQAGYENSTCKTNPYSKVVYAETGVDSDTYVVNVDGLVLAKLKYTKEEA